MPKPIVLINETRTESEQGENQFSRKDQRRTGFAFTPLIKPPFFQKALLLLAYSHMRGGLIEYWRKIIPRVLLGFFLPL